VPLHWNIDSREKYLTVNAEGRVTRFDFEELLEAAYGAGALSYRTVFDGTSGDFDMDESDVLQVGARLQDLRDVMTGPLAVVLSGEDQMILARLLGILATAPRPMRLFTSPRAARKWLAAHATRESAHDDHLS
jgi:hypothetical protein